jgi:hypothetical protein
MQEAKFSTPDVVMMAVTRGMLGAGIGLLLAGKLKRRRKAVGRTLVAIGTLASIPLGVRFFNKARS